MSGDYICPNCGSYFCQRDLCAFRALCDKMIGELTMSARPKGDGKFTKFEGFAEDIVPPSSNVPTFPDPYETLTEETITKHDPVNNPSHYTMGGIEVLDAVEAWGLDGDAYLFNAIKYIARAGKKDPKKYLEDLEKAQFYLNRKIANLKKGSR